MAAGDWIPGTTLKPKVVNVELDDKGAPSHVGIGYQVILPSGAIATERGWTWDAGLLDTPLRQAMERLLTAVRLKEGL